MKQRIVGLLCIAVFAAGCAGTKLQQQDLSLAMAIATNEAIMEDKGNRVALQELHDSLAVFCGQGEVDKLELYAFLRSKLGNNARLGYVFLLVDRFGGNINPSDYTAWGGVACKLRDGIKSGLSLAQK